MKSCPNCHSQARDDATFCPVCGTMFDTIPTLPTHPEPVYTPPTAQPAPAFDAHDHTSEFDAADITENKLPSMLVYLLGVLGMVIALLYPNVSPYRKFHIRQAMKFTVCEILLGLVAAVLCWTFVVPFGAGIALTVLTVIKAITFVQVCRGKAKDPAIIRSLKFLN